MEKIKALRWETGTIIPAPLAQNLCQREVQFFNQYDQLLTDYMADFELDLSAVRTVLLDDLKPPKDLYIEVRVLRDCGEVMTESGLVNLEAHSQHFLRRVDVEQLIRQGLLEQIKR
uniref:DNA replication complex GINS protein PSF1 C-terminal domain-containing protein n=1 Tax=Phytophthora ramorum TaxID=164328 RepID=H3GD70_PHYRM